MSKSKSNIHVLNTTRKLMPNDEVVSLLESVLDEARKGEVVEVAVVTVNSEYATNCAFVGDQDGEISQSLFSEINFLRDRISTALQQQRGLFQLMGLED